MEVITHDQMADVIVMVACVILWAMGFQAGATR